MVIDFGTGVSVEVEKPRDEYSCREWIVKNKFEVEEQVL